MFATKINKNPELFFVFVHRNATRCIGGQNKILIKFVRLRRMSSVTRFYNNAAKSSGNNLKKCRRFVFYGL